MTSLLSRIDSLFAPLDRLQPFADPLLRLGVGLLLMPHGAQKLFGLFGGHGIAGTGQYLASIGFAPGELFAIGLGLLEFVGGAMIALGLLVRPVALAVAGFMAVAIVIHWSNGYFWSAEGGGWEMPLLWGIAALTVAIRSRRSAE